MATKVANWALENVRKAYKAYGAEMGKKRGQIQPADSAVEGSGVSALRHRARADVRKGARVHELLL